MADDEPDPKPAPDTANATDVSATPSTANGGRVTPKAAKVARPVKVASPAAKHAEVKARSVKKSAVDDIRKAARSGDPRKAAGAVGGSSARYTPPIPQSTKVSPIWVPIIMFALLGLGMALIFLNYIGWPFGNPSNIRLIFGLAMILGGILVATQYH